MHRRALTPPHLANDEALANFATDVRMQLVRRAATPRLAIAWISFLAMLLGVECHADDIKWILYPADQQNDSRLVNWKAIAEADLIAKGTLIVPPNSKKLMANLESISPPSMSVGLNLDVSQIYKGRFDGNSLDLRYFPRLEIPGAPSVSMVSATADHLSIFFLSKYQFAGRPPEYSFARGPAIFDQASRILEQELTDEILSQAGLAQRVTRLFQVSEPPIDAQVSMLVERTLKLETAPGAIDELLALDQSAVPALVRHLDDRRPLAIKSITVRNRAKNSFEGLAHYSPELVVDLLSFVLSYKTEDGCSSTVNAAPEFVRQRVVQCWRVWLGRSLRLP